MYGLNIDPLNPDGNPTGAELRELGVKFARYSYIDYSLELDPTRLQFYQGKVAEYASAGVKSLLILTYDTYPNKPAYDAPEDEWDNYLAPFAARATELAVTLPGVYFQIWNEPDLPPTPGYEPGLREEVYGKMLRWTCGMIRYVAPGAVVIGAGLASGDPTYWSRVEASWPVAYHPDTFEPVKDAPLLDGIAIHPYGQRPTPDWPHPGWGFGYLGDLINAYRGVYEGPIWVTESGVINVTDEEQAEYLRQFYGTLTGQFAGVVPVGFWFCYSDGMVSPYGLRRSDSTPKPAYQAYEEVSRGSA